MYRPETFQHCQRWLVMRFGYFGQAVRAALSEPEKLAEGSHRESGLGGRLPLLYHGNSGHGWVMGTAKTTTLPTFVAVFACSLFLILWLASSYGFVIGCSYFCRFSHFVFIYLYTYIIIYIIYIYILIFFYIILFTGSHLYVSTDFSKLTTKARKH